MPQLWCKNVTQKHWASISWAWLLLECSRPWDQDLERRRVSEAARYGSAFHELLALLLRGEKLKPPVYLEIAAKHDVARSLEELAAHVRSSYDYFAQWLRGRNEFSATWDPKQALIEKAVALLPTKSARFIAPHDEEHRYTDLRPGELPGTLDYANTGEILLVIDHKTGEEDFSQPAKKPQLLTLAAAMMRLKKRTECIVGVLHARRRGLPKVYAEHVKLAEIAPFEEKLAGAFSRIGDGSLRPGPWCERCPTQVGCPARDAKLLEHANDLLGGLTDAGTAIVEERHMALVVPKFAALDPPHRDGMLYELAQLAERLSDRIRDELRRKILANPNYLPETRSGKYLIIREYDRENISKSSIVEALGKVKGELALTKLREAGAITKKRVVSLYLDKERGR